MKDNHNGPGLAKVKAMYPNASRYHYHKNIFNKNDCYWMVGIVSKCADNLNVCTVWQDVYLTDI